MMVLLIQAGPSAAQDQPARVQRITGRLPAGETHAYLLKDLRSGDRLAVSMRSTSGNLDPAIGIMDTTVPLAEAVTRYKADVQSLLAENQNVALALEDLRNRYFLAWDDDSGDGYAAALQYVVPAPGDYVLIAGSSLSALGRATAGDYEQREGLKPYIERFLIYIADAYDDYKPFGDETPPESKVSGLEIYRAAANHCAGRAIDLGAA